MNRNQHALSVLGDPRAEAVLARLHRAADQQNFKLVTLFWDQLLALVRRRPLPWPKLEGRLSNMYLAVDPANGILCYLLARALRARRIVEFGTSFGVSTIYFALAVRDNGGGVVIGSEMLPEKAKLARQHWVEAGVDDYIDLREGDALQTLRDIELPIDLFFNDGFPQYTLPVLKLLAPALRPGSITLCGNAALFPADHAEYLAWVRDPQNGFRSSPLNMTLAGELSVKG